jgi:hypothetical protein
MNAAGDHHVRKVSHAHIHTFIQKNVTVTEGLFEKEEREEEESWL